MITSNTKKSWRAVAVSEIGAAHVMSGTPCQDASRCFASADVLVACVADGAGSARYSDEAARTTVDAFVAVSKELLARGDELDPTEVVSLAFQAACLAVQEIAEGDLKEYATTLLGVVVRKAALAAIQVGDGAVIVDGEVVMHSHEGEYANETDFITNPDVDPRIFYADGEPRRVAIVTDGLENLVLENNGYYRAPHGPFFETMYEWLHGCDEPERSAQLGEFLVSDRVRSRTTDDLTLLLAMR